MRPFDLEICLPVFLKGKWRQRLDAFRGSGLLETAGVRARLVLLVGTQNEGALLEGWPVDEVTVFESDSDEAAAKIYAYYHNIELADLGRSRWFLRVDDDTSTNLSGLIHALDASYSFTEAHHLITWQTRAEHLSEPFPSWLNELGAGHIVSKHFLHDWEVSATSQMAMLRALSHPLCREVLRRATTLEGNWGDMGLAACCRVAGISPALCSFLDAGPAVADFSPFGGEKHHIHRVAPDQPESWGEFTSRLHEYRQQVTRPSQVTGE